MRRVWILMLVCFLSSCAVGVGKVEDVSYVFDPFGTTQRPQVAITEKVTTETNKEVRK